MFNRRLISFCGLVILFLILLQGDSFQSILQFQDARAQCIPPTCPAGCYADTISCTCIKNGTTSDPCDVSITTDPTETTATTEGCSDQDDDGFCDSVDECPKEPGSLNNGCPIRDDQTTASGGTQGLPACSCDQTATEICLPNPQCPGGSSGQGEPSYPQPQCSEIDAYPRECDGIPDCELQTTASEIMLMCTTPSCEETYMSEYDASSELAGQYCGCVDGMLGQTSEISYPQAQRICQTNQCIPMVQSELGIDTEQAANLCGCVEEQLSTNLEMSLDTALNLCQSDQCSDTYRQTSTYDLPAGEVCGCIESEIERYDLSYEEAQARCEPRICEQEILETSEIHLQPEQARSVCGCIETTLQTSEISFDEAQQQCLEETLSAISNIVINELAWMGNPASPDDEWIELYNNSHQDIDLTGWRLVALRPEGFNVELKGIVQGRDYFLMERGNDGVIGDITAHQIYTDFLLDEGMTLALLDPDGTQMDTVNLNGGPWPAGIRSQELLATMERTNPLAPDTDITWISNNLEKRNGIDRAGNEINGTPGERNSLTPSAAVDSMEDTLLGGLGLPSLIALMMVVIGRITRRSRGGLHNIVLLLIVACLITVIVPEVLAKTITVNGDGSGDFQSIQAAINSAVAGDVIRVAAGVYQESLFINKDDLRIVGVGNDQTIVESFHIALSYVGVASGRIGGFTFRHVGAESWSTVLIVSSFAEVVNNVITGATLAGVEIRGIGQPLLSHNQIQFNQGSGVLLDDGADAVLADNTLFRNGQAGLIAGVEVRGGSRAELKFNRILFNGGSGVYVHNAASVDAVANAIVGNTLHGISIADQASATLVANGVWWNEVGVLVQNAGSVILDSNVLAGNLLGMVGDGTTEFPIRSNNLFIKNIRDIQGVGLSSDDTLISLNALVHPLTGDLFNAIQQLGILIDEFQNISLESVPPTFLDQIQSLVFITATIYNDNQLTQAASACFTLVIHLDPNTALALEARQQLLGAGN